MLLDADDDIWRQSSTGEGGGAWCKCSSVTSLRRSSWTEPVTDWHSSAIRRSNWLWPASGNKDNESGGDKGGCVRIGEWNKVENEKLLSLLWTRRHGAMLWIDETDDTGGLGVLPNGGCTLRLSPVVVQVNSTLRSGSGLTRMSNVVGQSIAWSNTTASCEWLATDSVTHGHVSSDNCGRWCSKVGWPSPSVIEFTNESHSFV